MRILIGILHTIENEFEECLAAIDRQTHRDWDRFVLHNLPNKKSHEVLYQTFMERSSECDLFVKIDADMVLYDDDALARIVRRLRQTPAVDVLCVGVHDYFTDSIIAGMCTYRSHVRWARNDQRLFIDDWPVPPEKREVDTEFLAPIARHCPNPSNYQAFHFGFHRGLKVLESIRQDRAHYLGSMLNELELTREHFQRCPDPRLGLAVVGGELAICGTFQPEHVNYSADYPRTVCRKYEDLSVHELADRIEQLRAESAAVVPQRRQLVAEYRARNRPRGRVAKFIGRLKRAYRILRPKRVPLEPALS